MDPHRHEVRNAGIVGVEHPRNETTRLAGFLQDQCDTGREPALPIGCRAGEFTLMSRTKRLGRIGESFQSQRAQDRLVTDRSPPHR